jgi:7-carboxy-7-deazaguanine synthase
MLRVTEIFHSIQGESTQAGRPCVFVRLTGCPLRCRWCDTAYAFEGGTRMEVSEVVERAGKYGCELVEVTGGEPLAQKDCLPLLRELAGASYSVMLETGGAVSLEGIDPRVRIVMDLKCPDSGECHRNLWDNLERLRPGDEIKFVLASRRDYEWARDQVRERRLHERNTVLFSPVWGEVEPGVLSQWVLEDSLPARVQIQLHKILFGAETRGV